MKTIVVELEADVADGRLEGAIALARTFGSHVIGVQSTPAEAYVSFDPFGGVHTVPALLEALAEREQRVREAFESAVAGSGISWEYEHRDGVAATIVAERSRLADLVLLAKPGEDDLRRDRLAHVGDVVLSSSAPVLAVPPESAPFDPAARALIAWNGSPEGSRAVRAALPLLALAGEVVVLTAEEPGDRWNLPAAGLVEYLSRHGIAARVDVVEVTDADVPYTLLTAAADRDPAYLVMGAYGRSRAREWLLGGVTRRMILDLPAPLFLAH
jgi:nucleotide-binding universal stress UspA family protein